MTSNNTHISAVLFVGLLALLCNGIYVDKNNPYNVGKLNVSMRVVTEAFDQSPLHSVVLYPTESNNYSVVFFIGGLNGYILAEYYYEYMSLLATHGFVVIGVDYKFPVFTNDVTAGIGQDLTLFFKQIDFMKSFIAKDSKFSGINVDWSKLGLLCHSSGCDCTLRMIRMNYTAFTASVFLEPVSIDALQPINDTVPALMYGTQYSEEGKFHCCLKGIDYNRFYEMWKCPRIVVEVAEFGHCDILDYPFWEACHLSKVCKTTNDTFLPQYRQFIQGVTASFFITELQGLASAVGYITDPTKSPYRLLEDKFDFNCEHRFRYTV